MNLGLNRISFGKIRKLDWGSIRWSPRYCWSTPYRLTIRNSARLLHHVLFNMGDLHLVLPALNLSSLNAGILIMMHQVRLIMFSLNMVDYSLTFLLLSTWDFFCWTSRGDHSEPFLLFEVYCGTPPSCLKVGGGWVGGVWGGAGEGWWVKQQICCNLSDDIYVVIIYLGLLAIYFQQFTLYSSITFF